MGVGSNVSLDKHDPNYCKIDLRSFQFKVCKKENALNQAQNPRKSVNTKCFDHNGSGVGGIYIILISYNYATTLATSLVHWTNTKSSHENSSPANISRLMPSPLYITGQT